MKRCGQDCAVICGNCIHYGVKDESGFPGVCLLNSIPVEWYDFCDDFNCKRKKDDV